LPCDRGKGKLLGGGDGEREERRAPTAIGNTGPTAAQKEWVQRERREKVKDRLSGKSMASKRESCPERTHKAKPGNRGMGGKNKTREKAVAWKWGGVKVFVQVGLPG